MVTWKSHIRVKLFIFIGVLKDILPSFLRKRKAVSSSEKNTGKRSKSMQVLDRDIICIPDSKSCQKIPYPRGKYRSQLGEDGVIGKIRLISTMTE